MTAYDHVQGIAMAITRYTSMTRTRFLELRKQMLDGSLTDKWTALENSGNLSKADKVEERQIRAIGIIYKNISSNTSAILNSDKWKELHIVNDNGIMKLQVR
jgi:hypothetical protein